MTQQTTPRTILITGATGGMGRACALLAAERGNNLILSDLNAASLQNLATECSQFGVTVAHHALDIADPAAIDGIIAVLKSGAALDAVIHTVGLSPHMAQWQKIIEVDLIGTVDLLEKLQPLLTTSGCAVCIASMSGHMIPANREIQQLLAEPLAKDLMEKISALPGQPLNHPGIAYAYAKQALMAYVARGAITWGREGKRLVSISPGLIDTPMGQLEAEADKDGYASMRSLIPLQRDGLPREIASAALFLASEEASYISGCDFLVDGGFVGAFRQTQLGK